VGLLLNIRPFSFLYSPELCLNYFCISFTEITSKNNYIIKKPNKLQLSQSAPCSAFAFY
jgi:hypothetical protein